MGAILTSKLRAVDISARFGGDEFVILLPETPKEAAGIVAEKIMKSFEKSLRVFLERYETNSTSVIPANKRPGISMGIAECDENAEWSPEELLPKADKALYSAKELGKGKIAFFEEMV